MVLQRLICVSPVSPKERSQTCRTIIESQSSSPSTSVKTDSIFYQLFLTYPALFFELIGQPPELATAYEFKSVELKQTAFRIDGVFLPSSTTSTRPVYFGEVQFQRDPLLYHRFFAEIFLYLRQNPTTPNTARIRPIPPSPP